MDAQLKDLQTEIRMLENITTEGEDLIRELFASCCVLRHENGELRRENDELRRQVEELSKLTARMSEGDKAVAFLAGLPSMTTDDAELKAKIDEAFYTMQSDVTIWHGVRDLPHEIWRDIKNYEDLYQVSNFGRAKSFKSGKPKIFSLCNNNCGYVQVRLYKDGGKEFLTVHRLVAEAFIPNPDGKPFVNHKNGNKTDNRVENLEWVTVSENLFHAYRIGLTNGRRKLTDDQVRYVRENPDGLMQKELGQMFGLLQNTISSCRNGKTYKNVK